MEIIKRPKGINVYTDPTNADKIGLITKINKQGFSTSYICFPNIQPTYVTGSILNPSTKYIVYGWNSDINEPTLADKFITSILIVHDTSIIEKKTDLSFYIDVICTTKLGHGYALFSHFVGFLRNTYPNKTISLTLRTAKGSKTNLIGIYERWGFKKVSSGCSDDCLMTYTI